MPALYVAIYRPRDGNVKHWALFLEGEGIYEVEGDPMEFELSIRTGTRPQRSRNHLRNIFVADIDDVDDFDRIVRECEIQNDVQQWNCQQFVLDVLESLNDEDIIGDYEYNEAKQKLERIFDE